MHAVATGPHQNYFESNVSKLYSQQENSLKEFLHWHENRLIFNPNLKEGKGSLKLSRICPFTKISPIEQNMTY